MDQLSYKSCKRKRVKNKQKSHLKSMIKKGQNMIKRVDTMVFLVTANKLMLPAQKYSHLVQLSSRKDTMMVDLRVFWIMMISMTQSSSN